VLLAALLAAWSTGPGANRTQTRSPSDLIKFLTHQSYRSENAGGVAVSSLCQETPEFTEDRAAADALVKSGAPAVPDLEEALDSIVKGGERSPFAVNAFWLLHAYAKIKGTAAFPQLRSMLADPKLSFLGNGLDGSIALSLGLTSYLSNVGPPITILRCTGGEPRDGLDRLILAWERNDQGSLEAALGQDARTALHSLLTGREWADLRTEVWPGELSAHAAMGYRFEARGDWAEPDDPLHERYYSSFEPRTGDFVLNALLKNSAGRDCGNFRIKFIGSGGGGGVQYLVNNSDLGALLRIISACASQATAGP
jgi:hypothetical protein